MATTMTVNGQPISAAAQQLKEEQYNFAVANHRELEVDKLYKALIKLKGSDLHLKVAKPPYVRVRGSLKSLNRGPIWDEEMARLCVPMMDERNRRIFEETGGADFAYSMPFEGDIWRFRVNLLRQLGHIGLVAPKGKNLLSDFSGVCF